MHGVADFMEAVVGACVRARLLVVALGLLAAGLAVAFAVHNFAMSTDTRALISPELDFRVAEAEFERAFPNVASGVLAVLDAPTAEGAELAVRELSAALRARPDIVSSVEVPDDDPFLVRHGLLFSSVEDVEARMNQLIQAQPFLGPLAADPSLRGIANTLALPLQGVASGDVSLADVAAPYGPLAGALENALEGRARTFGWSTLLDDAPDTNRLRRIMLIQPVRDFTRLRSAAAASEGIRAAASELDLESRHGARLRLTGPAMLADEELGSLAEHAGIVAGLMVLAIVGMIWMAVRSVRVTLCILIVTFCGLALAAALGLALFGRFNVISVAFIPLFVGLGVDFGIQFGVRTRTEQRHHHDLEAALRAAARGTGGPIALAALAISVGFLAFLPTEYDGVSELGAIAGFGLLMAFALSLTMLPALLAMTRPSGHVPALESAVLAAVGLRLLHYRRAVLAVAALAALGALALMPRVSFDFNPINLRDPDTESVSTLLELAADPRRTPNVINVLEADLDQAMATAAELSALAEVDGVATLASFVPADQAPKLALIEDAALVLEGTFDPYVVEAAPTDAQVVAALQDTAAALEDAAASADGDAAAAAAARRLAVAMAALADGTQMQRDAAAAALLPGLELLLEQLGSAMQAGPVTLDTLPESVRSNWIAADGRARVTVFPAGNSNDNAVLREFAAAVRDVAPTATGAPIWILESGAVVVDAFLRAGILSFVAISLLLILTLRRVRDVLLTVTPIVLTGLLTLGTCVVIGQPLNFANIIALPLLFGMGVAYHVYFVMAWRDGQAQLLTSPLTRAVFFSALTTATGFGTLYLSSHPGTSSMGLLLAFSLGWTLVSALLFQPALMGWPRAEPKETAASAA